MGPQSTSRSWRGMQVRIRRRISSILLTLVVAIGVLLVAIYLSVPHQLTILTGPAGSATHEDGLAYEAMLEPRGLEVTVIPTDGGLETLQRLANEGASQIGFALVGLSRAIADTTHLDHLSSLGAVSKSPVWLLRQVRSAESPVVPLREELADAHLAIGPDGSEVHVVTQAVIDVLGMSGSVVTEPYDDLTADEAYRLLSSGELDGAFLIGDADAPDMQLAWKAEGIEPVTFDLAPALAARVEGFSLATIPAGVLDPERHIPRSDLTMIAAIENVVTTKRLNPAVVDLVLETMERVHSAPTLLTKRNEFPAVDNLQLPLNETAADYYEDGRNGFLNVFPYWLAKTLQRFWLVIVAILGGFVILLQILPMLISLPFIFTMNRFYVQLEKVEKEAGPLDSGADIANCLERLLEIDRQSVNLWVPPPQRAPYFELRQNIHDMRDRLRERLENV